MTYFNRILFLILTFAVNVQVLASSAKMKSWGTKAVSEAQAIAPSWIMAAIAILGFLTFMGSQKAEGKMSQVLMGGAMIFGAGAIVAVLKSVLL